MATAHASIPFFITFLYLLLPLTTTAITVEIVNKCPYTVWAAILPGGGRQLNPTQNWTLSIPDYTENCRVWGRTNCSFNEMGVGRCETGDCGGRLACRTKGKPPYTGVGFQLNHTDGMDYYHLTLTTGFNVPIELSPENLLGTCESLQCSADIVGQCPMKLRAPGGCNDPCTALHTHEECCTGEEECGQTPFNKFFKDLCPQAWSYPQDNSTINCPAGNMFRVTFCPLQR